MLLNYLYIFVSCSISPMSTPTKKFTPSGTKVRKRKRGREESTPDFSHFHRMCQQLTPNKKNSCYR